MTQHLYKPDGRRYPDTRPDGLVRQGQLIKLLGIGESTFLRWQERGFITPVKREGHCTLYTVPTPEELQAVRERIHLSRREGAALGGHNTAKRGASPAALDHARQVHIDAATARREAGLLNKVQMATALGVCLPTLARWIYQGHIAPALRRGQHSYFVAPDEALRAKLLEVAVGRLAPGPSQRVAQPEGTLSMQEIKAIVGVSDCTIHTWIKRGLLPPPVARGPQNEPYFLQPTQEQINHARSVMACNLKSGNKTGGANSLGKGWHGAPDGFLTIPGAAHRLGVTAPCVRRRIQQGYIAVVEGRWISVEEMERYIAAGCPHAKPGPVKSEPKEAPIKPKKLTTPPTNPRQKPSVYTPPAKVLKPFVPEIKPTALNGRALPPPLPSGYEEAVRAGRDDSRYQSVLGFNLLVCRSEGFRVAPVNEKPETGSGWRYHERHHLNGYRQWQVKAQRPLTGEILL